LQAFQLARSGLIAEAVSSVLKLDKNTPKSVFALADKDRQVWKTEVVFDYKGYVITLKK
jgi:hypothetical protein